MSLLALAGTNSATGGYDIDNSCKFEADNQEEFIRTPSSASNQKTWTVSMWFKRTELNNYQMLFGCLDTYCYFDTSNNLTINFRGASENFFLITNRLFRDTSAWYHIVVVCDFTNSTAADRGRLYINGVRETSFSNSTYQNAHSGVSSSWNSGSAMAVGGQNGSTTFQSCGYMAEVHGVDGSALTADSFGEFDSNTGIWKPKEYTGTYGTNGFYFKFDSPSDMGNDSSENNNDFSVVNINQNDQATDTPTNNFATLNPLHYTTKYTITEGGTNQVSSANGWGTSVGSIGVTSGKWYFEIKSPDNNGYTTFGAIDLDSVIATYVNGDAHAGDAPYGISHYGGSGSIITNGSAVSGTSFPTWNTQTMGCALDLDNNKIYFSKDGTYGNSGNPVTGANGISLPSGGSGTWFFSTSTYVQPLATNQGGYTSFSISSAETDANGYGTFEYAPPSGYYALCTKNLEEFG